MKPLDFIIFPLFQAPGECRSLGAYFLGQEG
jgi:hypothetical protein